MCNLPAQKLGQIQGWFVSLLEPQNQNDERLSTSGFCPKPLVDILS